MSSLIPHATAYAAASFRPILVRANAKIPTQNDWQKSNLTSEAVATLFAPHRGNVGVTFPPELFALDVDGDEGRASLEQLKATHGDFTNTLAQRTQSGGLHYIFRKPANVNLKNAVRFMPGLDVRAEGGQIVVEPSTVDGRKYQWLNWDVLSGASPDIADAPGWLLNLLTAPAAIKPSPQAHSQTAATNEGGRNAGLTRLAGAMRRQGADVDAILAALTEHNAAHCQPPLPESELATIAASVARYTPSLAAVDVRDGTENTRALTELGNAQRLADLHGEHVRYVPEVKSWLYFGQGAWRWDTGGAFIRELTAQLPQRIYAEGAQVDMVQASHCAKWARSSQSARVIDNAVSLLSDQGRIRISLAMIDADPMLIGFDHARQVISLKTGIARASTPADYITKSLTPCTLGDSALAVRWRAFLGQVFAGDAELIDWLHRWCGYLLTGRTSEQIFLFFFGLGANGKSVFAETIRHVMGDYGRTVASETLTATKRQAGGASPDLADLIGCRLALSTETEDGSALAESLIKTITGGDAISTRKLYCEPVTFQPAFKLLMLGNHRPVIRGTDFGIWRRVRLVPFARTFTEQERDPHLLDTLKAEAPHILAWMVAGCLEWQRRGLADTPAAIANQTADYRKEQDVIGQFLAECTNTASNAEVDTGALYNSYRNWALDSGLKPASKVSLGRRLTERGFAGRKSSGRRFWMGLTLNANRGADSCHAF